jgi:hypothetical protein
MKTYPLTPEQFNALRTKLLQMGVQLEDGNDGEIAYRGIRLKYHYRAQLDYSTAHNLGLDWDSVNAGRTKGLLTLTILEKPFLISQGLIWGKVDEWIGV